MARKKFEAPRPLGAKVNPTRPQPFRIESRKQTILKQRRHATGSGAEPQDWMLGYTPMRAPMTGVKQYIDAVPRVIDTMQRRHNTAMRRANAWQRLNEFRGAPDTSHSYQSQMRSEQSAREARDHLSKVAHMRDEYPKFKRNMKAMGMMM